jgi:hypothetical protein
MYDRAAIYPFLDGSALGARECNVDFDTEFHELGGLLCSPVRAVSSFYYVEYSHVYALCRASQRCVQSRTCW